MTDLWYSREWDNAQAPPSKKPSTTAPVRRQEPGEGPVLFEPHPDLETSERAEGASLVRAVTDVLAPQVGRRGRELMEGLHPFDLVDGIEAFSLLVSSELRRGDDPYRDSREHTVGRLYPREARFQHLDQSLEIMRLSSRDGVLRRFPRSVLVVTIARSLHDFSVENAVQILAFLSVALREVPKLLPHAVAQKSTQKNYTRLQRVSAAEQEPDPFLRW